MSYWLAVQLCVARAVLKLNALSSTELSVSLVTGGNVPFFASSVFVLITFTFSLTSLFVTLYDFQAKALKELLVKVM